MPIHVEFSEAADILYARLSGLFNVESDERADRKIAHECKERNCRKVLIDFRDVEGMPKPVESYQSGASLEERGFTRNIQLAIVDRPDFIKANEFYALVAMNRGFQLRQLLF